MDDGPLLYMTTQPLPLDDDGRPALMASPLSSLSSSFPLRPTIMGNLVPATYNMWIGGTPPGGEASCSGDSSLWCHVMQWCNAVVSYSGDSSPAPNHKA